jgi:hypothetical protein
MGTIANGPNLPPPCPISPLDYFPSLGCLGRDEIFSLYSDLEQTLDWVVGRLSRFNTKPLFPSIGWEIEKDGNYSVLGNGLRLSGSEVRALIVALMMSDSFHESPREVVLKNFKKDNCPPKEKAGFVYLLHGMGTSFYKIGHTNCLDRRIKQISPKLPFCIELVHSIETDDRYILESFAHKCFEGKRLEGEWFELEEGDVYQIKTWGNYLDSSEILNFIDPKTELQGWEVDDPWHDKEFCALADRISWAFPEEHDNE